MAKTFTVYGKRRIVKDIRHDDQHGFEAYYKDYFIYVFKDGNGKWYAQCSAPDGGMIVDGFLGNGKRAAIQECLENIYYGEKGKGDGE